MWGQSKKEWMKNISCVGVRAIVYYKKMNVI